MLLMLLPSPGRDGNLRKPEPQAGTTMPPFHRFTTPAAVLDYEIVQEQASAFGRLGRGLETALAALRAFDAAHSQTGGDASGEAPPEQRRALVSAAGYALWMFVVQREACGLRETRSLMRDYKVPAEVQERMGVLPARKGGAI
jgi:hypothetical protein